MIYDEKHLGIYKLFEDVYESRDSISDTRIGIPFVKWLKQKYDVTDKDIEYSSCHTTDERRGKFRVDVFTTVRKCDDYLYRDGKKRADINQILHDFFEENNNKCFRLEYDSSAEDYHFNRSGLGYWEVHEALGCKK